MARKNSSNGFEDIFGTMADDTLNGGNGKDRISGGDGNDTISGGNGMDVLSGDAGDDIISGGSAKDVLDGGDGNDILNGGIGRDDLAGGAGADTFLFDATALKGGSDIVRDFTPALTTTTTDPNTGVTTTTTTINDVLELHDLLQGYDPLSSNLSDFLTFSEVGSNTVVLVDKNGALGGVHMTQIATLVGVTGLDTATLLADGNIIIS